MAKGQLDHLYILFELWLIMIFSPVANFAQQALVFFSELVVGSDEQDIPVCFLLSLGDEGEKFRRSSMQLHDRH